MLGRFPLFTFVGGIIVGLVMAFWIIGPDAALPSLPFVPGMPHATTTPSKHPANTAQSGAVSVADQSAGTAVAVDSVTVPPPGVWVAVREVIGSAESQDALGNVLGALRVGGPRTGISVPLLRATTPGALYAVELYRDDAAGAFDPAVDSVYVDFDTGMPVIAYFSTVP